MKKTNSTRFILIHGSWHGSWCWSYLTPLLESAGYTVDSPNLPGHGEDLTPFTEITFNSYNELALARVKKHLSQQSLVIII